MKTLNKLTWSPTFVVASLFVTIMLLLTCSGDDTNPALPAATQEGRGTLACYIDGERWVPYSSDFKQSATTARYLEQEKTLFIGGFSDKLSQGLFMGLANYQGLKGVYQVDSICYDLPRICANVAGYSTSKYLDKPVTYNTNTRYKGTVEITRHSGGIVSGLFEFQAENRITGKVVKLTEGRFDKYYVTY